VATLNLTDDQRLQLKRPLGELITGDTEECTRKLKEAIDKEKPPRLILVGDTVSRTAVQMELVPDVIMIDNQEKRRKAVQFSFSAEHTFKMRNSAGSISAEAWAVVPEAIRVGNSVVIVEGEEDLLTLVGILSSPDRSIVVYGQPDEGIVLVRVTEKKKKEISRIIERMEKRG
jgi:uncharacterized protein (UPF0218 family)